MTPEAEEQPIAEPLRRRMGAGGCLLRIAIVAAVATALVIAIGVTFDQDDTGISRPSSSFNAGPADEYERGDVNYFPVEHVFLTRLADGTFIALYDKSPKQQEIDSDCRVTYDELTGIGSLEPLEGIDGGLVENCGDTRAVWRADGVRAFGAGYGDLDRFETREDGEGNLIVDLSQRTCTRSRGVAGIPPFDVRTCTGRPD